ncbi:FAD-binding protein [Desulfobacterota bacterium M19]
MLKIDEKLCVGCGVCEDNCAFGAITVVDALARVNDKCTLCGNCVDSCEVGALFIEDGEAASSIDLAAYSGVWVYAEFRQGKIAPVVLELLGAGRGLADERGVKLSAVLLGHDLGDSARELIARGCDEVLQVDDPALENFVDESYTNVLASLIKERRPEIVLAGATAIGRSFIPQVATVVGAGLTADCTELAIDKDGSLLQTRPAFGGNIMATIVCPDTRPQMATVRPMVMKALPADLQRQGAVENLNAEQFNLTSRVRVLSSVIAEPDKIRLSEAEIVVAGGRGLESAKGFAMLKELAEIMGGSVAASRAAVDAGWIDYPYQVGQTGKTVAPRLYICCGISGAVQHLVGMQSSETIIAINRDSAAPIFNVATYGIVGDLFEILPLLINELKGAD